MAFYEARIDPPFDRETDERFIEALREYGSATILLQIEAPSKRAAAALLSESCSTWWNQYGHYEEDWFEDQLRTLRGKERATAKAKLTHE